VIAIYYFSLCQNRKLVLHSLLASEILTAEPTPFFELGTVIPYSKISKKSLPIQLWILSILINFDSILGIYSLAMGPFIASSHY
jgi:hypothetical protein